MLSCSLALNLAVSFVDCVEFWKVCSRTALGFVVMGFIGFFVKLIFIVGTCSSSQYFCPAE
jgi:hypothetical protein